MVGSWVLDKFVYIITLSFLKNILKFKSSWTLHKIILIIMINCLYFIYIILVLLLHLSNFYVLLMWYTTFYVNERVIHLKYLVFGVYIMYVLNIIQKKIFILGWRWYLLNYNKIIHMYDILLLLNLKYFLDDTNIF